MLYNTGTKQERSRSKTDKPMKRNRLHYYAGVWAVFDGEVKFTCMGREIKPSEVVKGCPLIYSTYHAEERNTSKLSNYQLNKLRKNV